MMPVWTIYFGVGMVWAAMFSAYSFTATKKFDLPYIVAVAATCLTLAVLWPCFLVALLGLGVYYGVIEARLKSSKPEDDEGESDEEETAEKF
jgi:hypothetical protein